MANISSDAQKVLQQAGQGAKEYVLQQGGFGGKLTSGEATRLLKGFQSSPLSGSNVIGAVTSPTGMPDFSDPFGARSAIGTRLGLDKATTREEEARSALTGFQQTTRELINKLRANRDLSAGLEAGFEAERTREAQAEEQTLVDALNLATQQRQILEGRVSEEFDVFRSELDTRRGLMATALEYGDTGVNINMSVTQLTQRAAKAKREALEKEARDAHKAELKSLAIQLGVSLKTKKGGTKSIDSLEKAIAKVNKSALDRENEKFDLEMESIKLDMKNTESIMANRGAGDEDEEYENYLDYSEKVADKVFDGTMTREQAKDRINSRFPGNGNIIYDLVPDNYSSPYENG